MDFSKKVASLGIAFALVSCLGVTTALGTNEANDPLAMSNVVDKSAGENLEYAGVAESGVAVSVTAPEGAFSDGAEMSVSDVVVPQEDLEEVVAAEASGDILGLSAVDISFEGEQPSEPVSVNIEVPASEVPEDATMALIVHMAENGPEVVGTASLDSSASKHSLSFSTDGFSSYVAVFVNGKYSSQKMSEALDGNTRYSIASFPVDLFDYDPADINNSLNAATADNNGFHFTGYGIAGMGSNSGINNSSSDRAKQGILEDTLTEDGLPIVNYLAGENAGVNTGKILFGDDYEAAGKTVYDDIDFEFVYDNQTGYYEYKSSANHAQLNTLADGSKKVELYADTLSTQNNASGLDQVTGNFDLSSSSTTHQVTINSGATANHLSATAERSSTSDRLDAIIRYPSGLSVDPSKVDKLQLKLKAPANLDKNEFRVYYIGTKKDGATVTEFNGNDTAVVAYTANDDWIEIELDVSQNASWNSYSLITGLRIDPFDVSANTNTQNKFAFELSDFKLIATSASAIALPSYTGKSSVTTVDNDKSTASHLFVNAAREEGARCDAYVDYANLSIDPSDADKLYLKIKVPSGVGENAFKVYFSGKDSAGATKGYHEDRAYKIPYTPNNDWIEFVIDTSDNSEWGELSVITGLRVDFFDTECTATRETYAVPAGTYAIEMSEFNYITEVPATSTTSYAHYGGFYPFTDIADSYPGNSEPFDLSTWEDLQLADGIATKTATRSMGNPTLTTAELNAELAYGIVMEFDFYIPVDKTGENLTYYFNGDDDLWVFVDGQLVLDIGGGHGAITGTANFTTGEIAVASAVNVTGYNSGATGTPALQNGSMNESLYSPGKHTMKVFYLERGGSVSNCFMKFNLPQTPKGSVVVGKTVIEENGESLEVLDDELFEFAVETKGLGANASPKAALANTEYYVVADGSSVVGGTTDGDGKFTLKHGQEAHFYIDENHEVTVTETIKDSITGYRYVSTAVDGTSNDGAVKGGNSLAQKTTEGEETRFAFVNTYEENQVGFTYVPINPADCPDERKGTVELTGRSDSATHDATGVSETVGTRTGNPAGSTARVEVDNSAVKFVGWYADEECTTRVSESVTFDPVKDGEPVWQESSYTYYAKFEYMYGDLTIAKSRISSVDHHAATANNAEESQSIVFNVKGTSYSGIPLDMDVVVHVDANGAGSTMIKALPVGEYVVTEKADWSWRYEIDGVVDSDKSTSAAKSGEGYEVIVDEDGNGLGFSNKRVNIYWLGGDNWCQNLFKADGIKKIVQEWTVVNGS